jgi:hypothetical protein
MSHTCDYTCRTDFKDLHRVKPNRSAGFKRAVRTLDGDTNCVQVSNLRSELSLGVLCVEQSNGMTHSETSLILSVTDIAVDSTGAVSFLSKLNSQLILFTMYNNSTTAIIEEMCDIKAFRFRHSAFSRQRRAPVIYLWQFRMKISCCHLQWSHELYVPPRDSTTVQQI